LPLPDPNSRWPLAGTDRKIELEMSEHSAWYSGEVEQLRRIYGGKAADDKNRPGRVERIVRRARQFWARQATSDTAGSDPIQMHIPLAGDIAATSADLLFSESPTIDIPDADQASIDRLTEIIEDGGVPNTFLEAGEVAAALGGAYLKVAWDEKLAERPLLTVVQADMAVPDFRYGILTGVTFHREIVRDGAKVYRHLERHEPGVIFHGLYEGTDETLGRKLALTDLPETSPVAGLITENGDEISVEGVKTLFCRYMPNIRPNRRHRKRYEGRSDFQGIEAIFDALDETWSSLMRDIRLGKARLIASADALTSPRARGEGATLNIDQEIFTALDFDPTDKVPAITPIEFTIRTEQHLKTVEALIKHGVGTAGYSAESFGLESETAQVTATEIRARERKSFKTRGKKERYVRQPIEESLEVMLAVDKAVFKRNHEVKRPRVTLADSIADSERERAETVQLLYNARAVSTFMRVKMLHPEWDDTEIGEEVQRINDEEGMNVPEPELPV
jgi:A118 family predicted phage portal protein